MLTEGSAPAGGSWPSMLPMPPCPGQLRTRWESEPSESPVCCVISWGTPTLESQKYPAFLPGSLNIPRALLSMSFTLFYLLVPLLLLPPI